MSELIKLGNHNLNLVMRNGEAIKVFINDRSKALNYIEEIGLENINKEIWISHTLDDIRSYGLLKPSNNKICIITKLGAPIFAYLNNIYKAESDFSMLSKNTNYDCGTYQIIRDVVITND